MPLNALVNGEMTRADRDGPREAQCFECGHPMIAKTGELVVWHWAHRAENPDCGLSAESEWHLAWKARGLDGTQEIVSENGLRRADVLSPARFAIEFQRSPLSWREMRSREADWDQRVVWVLDTHHGLKRGQIDVSGDDARLTWWRCTPTAAHAVGCRWD